MPQEVNIQELLAGEVDNGDPIKSISGRLTKLYPAKTTEYGSMQGGELSDEDGNVAKIVFVDDAAQPMSAKGKILQISSFESDGHGWTGVKRKDDKKDNIQIWVTGTANIEYEGGAPTPDKSKESSKPSAPNNKPQSKPTNTQASKPTKILAKRLEDLAHLQARCMSLVNENAGTLLDITTEPKTKASEGMELLAMQCRKELAISLFIQAERTGIAMMWDADTVDKKPLPPIPKDPKKWRECVIPSGKLEGKSLEEITDEQLLAFFKFYDDKKDNSLFAECVYQAAHDRKVVKKAEKPPIEPELENEENTVPF